jgi:hypothetical protein
LESAPSGARTGGIEEQFMTSTTVKTVERGLVAVAVPAIVLFAWSSIASADHVLEANLRGRSEVATGATDNRIVGDPNGRGEATVFSGGAGILCYTLEVSRIEPATAAHIHEAPLGANGPVVVTLAPPSDGESSGCVSVGALAEEILASPEDYYVNVHNAEYPGGAIRGQLS